MYTYIHTCTYIEMELFASLATLLLGFIKPLLLAGSLGHKAEAPFLSSCQEFKLSKRRWELVRRPG